MTRRVVNAGARAVAYALLAARVCDAQGAPYDPAGQSSSNAAGLHQPAGSAAAMPNLPPRSSRSSPPELAYVVRPHRLDLLHAQQVPLRAGVGTLQLKQPRDRLRLELVGARAQAEDWLRDAGFSLLEDRDGDGRRSYAVISQPLIGNGPVIRVHARVGRPQLSAGLTVRRDRPAFGMTMPWRRYTFELEGFDDQDEGYMLMGRFQWSDRQRRVQYGLALPVDVDNDPSIGILVQLRLRFDP
jgi:hypothetical protein